MNQPFYNFNILNQALRFDFLSTGRNIVSKSVIYTETDIPNFYSLSLLDVYPDGSTDDTSVTNNGDMEKILVTVFHTFAVFFKNHPSAIVAFQGSTPSRTRLYRIALSHELSNISRLYTVWGVTNLEYELFRKDRPYIGFLLSLKGINIA